MRRPWANGKQQRPAQGRETLPGSNALALSLCPWLLFRPSIHSLTHLLTHSFIRSSSQFECWTLLWPLRSPFLTSAVFKNERKGFRLAGQARSRRAPLCRPGAEGRPGPADHTGGFRRPWPEGSVARAGPGKGFAALRPTQNRSKAWRGRPGNPVVVFGVMTPTRYWHE